MATDSAFFSGFTVEDVPTSGASIRTLRKGDGPPLLLLHGYQQTRGRRATRHLFLSRDGSGSARRDAHFGHERFLIAAHDRGARTAHRLCLDHPEAVSRVCHFLADERPDEVLGELLRFFDREV